MRPKWILFAVAIAIIATTAGAIRHFKFNQRLGEPGVKLGPVAIYNVAGSKVNRSMFDSRPVKVAIVDYGLGNLFSVKHACIQAGIQPLITSSKQEILNAEAVILPGVGAFGDAMTALQKFDLVSVLKDIAETDKPLIGICLGMQLLMSESYEFGWHEGLDIIKGTVKRFENPNEGEKCLKVPQVGWNRVYQFREWVDTPLAHLANGEFMYFVHSYCVYPENQQVILSVTQYGNLKFCSSLIRGNLFACQFHPERSGQAGLRIYHRLRETIALGVLG